VLYLFVSRGFYFCMRTCACACSVQNCTSNRAYLYAIVSTISCHLWLCSMCSGVCVYSVVCIHSYVLRRCMSRSWRARAFSSHPHANTRECMIYTCMHVCIMGIYDIHVQHTYACMCASCECMIYMCMHVRMI